MKELETLIAEYNNIFEDASQQCPPDATKILSFGLDDDFSKKPKEKVRMPAKSVADVIKLAADGEEEFVEIVKDVMSTVKGAEGRGRIKDTWKIEEKCNRYGIEPCDLDDASGKEIIVKTVKDLEKVGEILKKHPKVFRQFDYYSPSKRGAVDGLGTYEIHADMQLSNGLVCELMVVTKMIFVYKTICWHHAYQVFRESIGYMRRNPEATKTLGPIVGKLQEQMAANGKEVYKADISGGKAPYLDLDFTDEELKEIKKAVTEKTYDGFIMLLEHKTKEANTKTTQKEKDMIEHLSLEEYVKNAEN